MAGEEIKAYIFDLDGVIYRGDELQPSAAETIQTLRSQGRKVYFLTNNSTQSRRQYSDKLTRLGIPTEPHEVMTSAYATALYLKERKSTDGRAYVVGECGLKEELRESGICIAESLNGRKIDFVVVGLDRQFDYQKLYDAQQAIFGGAEFVATNCDPTYPLEGGTLSPGGGSMVSAVATASGVKPFVVGKPHTYSLEIIMSLAEAKPEETVIIGDRLDTDIWVGKRAGTHTVLVLTGVTTEEEAYNAPDEMKPERIIYSLRELLQ
ncbi:MAG: phosphoglycolate/pyridoxal phosphate family phosphatase [Armatimonadota bacterium]|nr:phosphoglycolate/pyridoxal phosphate family phosphatase [Armatimonadota bacterium]